MIKKIRSWFAFLRIPNLFTVPGDCIAGFVIYSGDSFDPVLIPTIFASLSLYIFGIISNDIADFKVDMEERPSRPLPSGQISMRSALIISVIFALLGLGGAFLAGFKTFVSATAILFAILIYNFKYKKSEFTGPFLLGFCRAMNILLGVTASNIVFPRSGLIVGAVAFIYLYVHGLSTAAQVELKPSKVKLAIALALIGSAFVLWPAAGIISAYRIIYYMDEIPPAVLNGLILCGVMIGLSLLPFINSMREKAKGIEDNIAILIRNLILFQASACFFAGAPGTAKWILLLYVPAYILSKFFKGS